MRCPGNAIILYTLLLFVFSTGFAAMGCSETPGNSGNIQNKKNAAGEPPEGGSKAASQEEKICGKCHKEQVKFLAYGGHSDISCETCHGVKGNHIKAKTKPTVRGNDQCIECHELVEGSEAENLSEKEMLEHHLKFVEKKHVIEVKRKKVKDRCVYCHDPHLGQ